MPHVMHAGAYHSGYRSRSCGIKRKRLHALMLVSTLALRQAWRKSKTVMDEIFTNALAGFYWWIINNSATTAIVC